MISVFHQEGRTISRDTLAPFSAAIAHSGAGVTASVIADGAPWASGRVLLAQVERHQFRELEEPDEPMADAIASSFRSAAEWMRALDPNSLTALRERGFKIDVFCEIHTDNGQVELAFPPEFLRECGRCGLPIRILSNP